MKRIILILMLIFLSVHIFSQKFYIKPNVGYSIETFKKGIITDSIFHMVYSDTIITSTKETLNNFSLIKGWNAGITLGYKFNSNIGIEMGISYYFGKPTSIEFSERYNFIDNPHNFVQIVGTNIYKSKVISLSPSILISKPFGDFIPYIKIGGCLNYILLNENYSEKVTTTLPGYFPFSNITSELRYNRSLSIGLLTSIGMDYQGSNI